jgi:hypothetical protein
LHLSGFAMVCMNHAFLFSFFATLFHYVHTSKIISFKYEEYKLPKIPKITLAI